MYISLTLWPYGITYFTFLFLCIQPSSFGLKALPRSGSSKGLFVCSKNNDVQDEIINANLGWCSWKAIYSPFHQNFIVLSFHFYTENINILWILKIRKNYKTPLQSKAMKYCSRGNLQFNLHQVSNRLLREFKNFEFTQKFVSLRPGADPLKRKKSCLTTWGPFYKS